MKSKRSKAWHRRTLVHAILAVEPDFAFELAVMGPNHYTIPMLEARVQRRVPPLISLT